MNESDSHTNADLRCDEVTSTQAQLQLQRLIEQLEAGLPQLSPQHDSLLGTALLHLAIKRLTAAHGQKITADLLAGTTELLWNNSWQDL